MKTVVAVDIWHANLAASADGLPTSFLSHDEEKRSNRLRGERNHSRWICSRLALRSIVAKYCHSDPAAVRFEYGLFGKPRLAADASRLPLHFSLTRSGDLCLIAICRTHAVGIDVEQMSFGGGEGWITNEIFTEREAAALQSGTAMQKNRAFLDSWTRKEACAKAIGMGLQHRLRDFDVSAADGDQLVNCPAGIGGWTTLRLITLSPPAGYLATVAVRQESGTYHSSRIQIRTFTFESYSIPISTPPIELSEARACKSGRSYHAAT